MELRYALKARYGLSDETVSELFEGMERVAFTKGDTVQREGAADRYLYFIESGVLRTFVRRDGKDVTLFIASEGDRPLQTSGLTRPRISGVGVIALTDCVLWRLPRVRLGRMCSESLAFANLARVLAEDTLSETEAYWTDYYSLSKKDQYELLMRRQPELLRRIPLSEVASYIGVTPQSLSRIRARRH